MNNIHEKIFKNYNKIHISFLDGDDSLKLSWFKRYADLYFFPHFKKTSLDAPILEIGCNRGFLIKTFFDKGYTNLTGIDLSPIDLEYAKKMNTGAKLILGDAYVHLQNAKGKYSVIIIKAVMEHIHKDKIPEFIHAMGEALSPGGVLLIDVPNMDWLFASHERYMDFTHEVGFTKESLGQLLRLEFGSATIYPVDNNLHLNLRRNILKNISRYFLTKLFCWADPEIALNPIWCKTIVGVAYADKRKI
jgi:SAM-dependent methyltransferase